MGKDHRGKPSGIDKKESLTGIPSQPGRDEAKLTEKYTEDDQRISDSVHTGHPNRNVDKENSTNGGGYKGGT
jgi:hypothetical protein